MTSTRPPRAIVLLRSDDRVVARMVVPGTTRCDLRLVDDLLRLRLNAGRLGWTMDLRELAPDLGELFDLMGLEAEVRPPTPPGTAGVRTPRSDRDR